MSSRRGERGPSSAGAVTEARAQLTYAIAPPNRTTPLGRRREIAAAQSARISSLPIDALLIYDVQDEAARTDDARPFPFVPKVDPLAYAFDELALGTLPRVVYRAVAAQSEASLCRWLDELRAREGRAVLVGAPSRRAEGSLTLSRALAVCRRRAPELSIGGVVIPERHAASGDEEARVWTKMQAGCRFFVSQTVWSVRTTQRLLTALRVRADVEGVEPPPLLLTLSPCGSAQTLEFLRWLGVDVPPQLRRELLDASDMLERSIELAAEGFAQLQRFAEQQGLVVGCNVESLTARPADVDASVELLERIHRSCGIGTARRVVAASDEAMAAAGGRELSLDAAASRGLTETKPRAAQPQMP